MKNGDIRAKMRFYGVEWVEVAKYLQIPMKDLTRRLNAKEVTPQFRRRLIHAIESISQRSETFYDEYR